MKLAERALLAEPFHAMAFGQRAAELEAAGHRVIKLSLGEPNLGRLRQCVTRCASSWTDGRCPTPQRWDCRPCGEAIAGFYRDRHAVEVDPAHIVVTSGASCALLLAVAATVEPGDEVLMADPSYPAIARSYAVSEVELSPCRQVRDRATSSTARRLRTPGPTEPARSCWPALEPDRHIHSLRRTGRHLRVDSLAQRVAHRR